MKTKKIARADATNSRVISRSLTQPALGDVPLRLEGSHAPKFSTDPLVPSVLQFSGREVRFVIDDSDREWFCGNDLAGLLGIVSKKDSTRTIPLHEKVICKVRVSNDVGRVVRDPHTGKTKARDMVEMYFVNEPGMYRMIFRSRIPLATQFQDHVFYEVLPSIRRHGCYPPPPDAKAYLDLPSDLKPYGKPDLERYEERYQVAKWLKAIAMVKEYAHLSRNAAYHQVVKRMEGYGISVASLRRYNLLFAASGGDFRSLIGAQYRAGRPPKRDMMIERGVDEVWIKARKTGLYEQDLAGK